MRAQKLKIEPRATISAEQEESIRFGVTSPKLEDVYAKHSARNASQNLTYASQRDQLNTNRSANTMAEVKERNMRSALNHRISLPDQRRLKRTRQSDIMGSQPLKEASSTDNELSQMLTTLKEHQDQRNSSGVGRFYNSSSPTDAKLHLQEPRIIGRTSSLPFEIRDEDMVLRTGLQRGYITGVSALQAEKGRLSGGESSSHRPRSGLDFIQTNQSALEAQRHLQESYETKRFFEHQTASTMAPMIQSYYQNQRSQSFIQVLSDYGGQTGGLKHQESSPQLQSDNLKYQDYHKSEQDETKQQLSQHSKHMSHRPMITQRHSLSVALGRPHDPQGANSTRSKKAYSSINSVNTAMQVRLYKQRQSTVVPECFKAALPSIEELAKSASFTSFKQKATRVTADLEQSKTEVYSLSRIVKRSSAQINQVEYRALLKMSASMPFSFIMDQVQSTDAYAKWMQPMTATGAGQATASRARLVTSLGENSDLIELNIETPSMMFFKQTHTLRMIRSIFPLGQKEQQAENPDESAAVDEEAETVDYQPIIGFKLAKKAEDCQEIQIFLTRINDLDDDYDDEQQFQLYLLIESTLPRFSSGFRHSVAQKLGTQLITCFCNLETFLNLEFEAGKQQSESGSSTLVEGQSEETPQPFAAAVEAQNEVSFPSPRVKQKGTISDGTQNDEHQASPHSLSSLQVSAIKPEQSSHMESIQMNSSGMAPLEECKLMKKPILHKIQMGTKYLNTPGGADESIIYSGDDADNERDEISLASPQLPGAIQDNPLEVTPTLKLAIERQKAEQLRYEIPVDLEQCTEEEKELWLIRKANIRNGGRPRENPLFKNVRVDPAACRTPQGDWTKNCREKFQEEVNAQIDELNALCDANIATDYLSENHRIRYLVGNKLNVQAAFDCILRGERLRYNIGCNTLTAADVMALGQRAHCIIGKDNLQRPVVYTQPALWRLGEIEPEDQIRSMMFLSDYIYARLPNNIDNFIWIFDLEGFGYQHCFYDHMKRCITLISQVFVGNNQKIVCTRPNFVTRMVWNTLSPFLTERVRNKVCFINTLDAESFTQAGLHLQAWPREWGGHPEGYSVDLGQQRQGHLELPPGDGEPQND